jgi:hypothetical protein
MLRNVGDTPLTVSMLLSVDGIRAGQAKALSLPPGLVRTVTMPLEGVRANGTAQKLACVIAAGGYGLMTSFIVCAHSEHPRTMRRTIITSATSVSSFPILLPMTLNSFCRR